ncbi:MAG TPA: YicC/YloC family endoribonuclease [Acidobacteriota bacterium]|nr:YicC/YloC family endoribonuclease [Acidobacteriota bacterium]
MRSMTGYGHAVRSGGDLEIAVDIKTVNGRYLDIAPRLPKELAGLENPLKKSLQPALRRGRVEIYLNLTSKALDQYQLNEPLVENYLAVARRAGAQGVEGTLELNTLLALPGVLVPKEQDLADDRHQQQILEAVQEALEQVVEERRSEGATLKRDLAERLQRMSGLVESIEQKSEMVRDHYRKKLTERVERMAQDQPVDPARLAQEILYYCEKADISEEITRLRRHIERFSEQIEVEDASIGKGLDFLCQEMNRESNTILSKSQAGDLSELALEAKTEVERIREQVQNVE